MKSKRIAALFYQERAEYLTRLRQKARIHSGKVNILDIGIVAKAYGTTPEDPSWNPIADMAEPYNANRRFPRKRYMKVILGLSLGERVGEATVFRNDKSAVNGNDDIRV